MLTPLEKAILERLLAEDIPGVSELRAQLTVLRAKPKGITGSLKFRVPRGMSRANILQPPLAAEGYDPRNGDDGVHALLFVTDGLLNELQLYRNDGREAPIVIVPDRLVVWH